MDISIRSYEILYLKLCAILQSDAHLHFAPRLQHAYVFKCARRFYQHLFE